MNEIRRHHIRFKDSPDTGVSEDWAAELGRVHGVSTVEIDAAKRDVFVEYDLRKCCEEAIEHRLVSLGFTLEDGFMERLKRGYIHYTEKNEMDSLEAEPGSCCDVDEIEKKREEMK